MSEHLSAIERDYLAATADMMRQIDDQIDTIATLLTRIPGSERQQRRIEQLRAGERQIASEITACLESTLLNTRAAAMESTEAREWMERVEAEIYEHLLACAQRRHWTDSGEWGNLRAANREGFSVRVPPIARGGKSIYIDRYRLPEVRLREIYDRLLVDTGRQDSGGPIQGWG